MSPRISISLLPALSDERLVWLARHGHERAFEVLVQRYRCPLLRYCRRMRVPDSRAEDVLQHTLLQAWLALAAGADIRELKPWLYRIAHNTAVNALRGSAEDHGQLTDALRAAKGAVGESDLDPRIAVRDALTDVAALPRMQRQAILLSAVEGHTHDELASVLGISHGAVRGLLYRARATLRSAAVAITPQPLIAWASGGAGGVAPTAERGAELSAGGGAVGMAGMLVKGAVVAVTAGALVGGAAVHRVPHAARRSTGGVSSAAVVSAAGRPRFPGARAAVTTDTAAGRPRSPGARAAVTTDTSVSRTNAQATSGAARPQIVAGILHGGRGAVPRGVPSAAGPALPGPAPSSLQPARAEHDGAIAAEGRHHEAQGGLETTADTGRGGPLRASGDHSGEAADRGGQRWAAKDNGSGADRSGAVRSGSDGSGDGEGGSSPKHADQSVQTGAGGDRHRGDGTLAASAESTSGPAAGGGSGSGSGD